MRGGQFGEEVNGPANAQGAVAMRARNGSWARAWKLEQSWEWQVSSGQIPSPSVSQERLILLLPPLYGMACMYGLSVSTIKGSEQENKMAGGGCGSTTR